MSAEASPLEMALKAVVGTAVGVGLSLTIAVASSLIAEHLKRKADKGLLHWPGRPNARIYLGGPPPEALVPATPPPPAPRPATGPQVNLSGLVPLPPALTMPPREWQ